MAKHPSLPLYLTANTKSEIRLWHFLHEYPLATFSLPGGSGKSAASHLNSAANRSGRLTRPSRTDSASRSAGRLNIKSTKSEKKRTSSVDPNSAQQTPKK